MTPSSLKRALALGAVRRRDVARLLVERADRPPRRPHLTPKTAPPPERLKLVRTNGRLRRPRSPLTKALIEAGAVDPVAVKARRELP